MNPSFDRDLEPTPIYLINEEKENREQSKIEKGEDDKQDEQEEEK